VYEVGNGVELARGNSNNTPLCVDSDGNTYIVTEATYGTINSDPLVYHNGQQLIYDTDYYITSTLDKKLVIQFNTGYDSTVDYIVYSVIGNSITFENIYQYDYSIPLTETFTNIDVSGVLTLVNPLPLADIWVAGSPELETTRALSHVIVELNGLRLQYNVDYTIDATNKQITIIWDDNYDNFNSENIVAVTTFNDTSRQHLQTITSTGVVSKNITISSPTINLPKESIKYTDSTRTWVTINGHRVDASRLSFNDSNVLTINVPVINAEDVVTVTSMVSTASPNSNKFMISLDKAQKSQIYSINQENTSWLMEDLYPDSGDIHLNDVSKFIGLNFIKINNEKIRFSDIDLVANTLSGLTRGALGTGLQNRMVPKYTYGYVMGNNKLSAQYNNQIFTTSIAGVEQPLQLSTGDAGNFLNTRI